MYLKLINYVLHFTVFCERKRERKRERAERNVTEQR